MLNRNYAFDKTYAKDYLRKFFFGAAERAVPKEFDHSGIYESTNQEQKMDCVFEGTVMHLAIKYFLETGKKLVVNTNVAWRLASLAAMLKDEDGDPLFDEKRGAHINAGLQTTRKSKGFVMKNEDGDEILCEVEKFFYVDNDELDEEIFYGGSVISGVSSRIGIDISPAKYRPYFARLKTSNKNDGHCIIKTGKQKVDFWETSREKALGLTRKVMARVLKNSYGKKWGNNGSFYLTEKGDRSTFRNIGSVAKFTNLTRKEGEVKKQELFKDVGEKSAFYKSIKKAKESGVMTGYDDGRFGPSENITRAHMAVILDRLGLLDKESQFDRLFTPHIFTEVEKA